MTKRFKALNQALNYLKTSDDQPNPQAPANTPLRKYQEWKSGERNVEYDRAADSLPEKLLTGAISPFSLPFDTDNKVLVPVSKRVDDNSVIKNLYVDAGLAVSDALVGTTLKGFTPAKCTVNVRNEAGDRASETSKLTGVKYAKRGYKSYTFPYGAKSNTSKDSEVRAAIKAKLGASFNGTTSFQSEDF